MFCCFDVRVRSSLKAKAEIRQFIVNGINNRFRPPTLDGRNAWHQYYRNMYNVYKDKNG